MAARVRAVNHFLEEGTVNLRGGQSNMEQTYPNNAFDRGPTRDARRRFRAAACCG